jgi:transitional endoplasmic reticulum ATPase
MSKSLKLKVTEAQVRDVGRALARLDPADMATLGVQTGDLVEVVGKRATVCKVIPAHKELRGQSRVQIDGVTRANAGVVLDQPVEVRPVTHSRAERVTLTPVGVTLSQKDVDFIARKIDGLPVVVGDRISISLLGSRTAEFQVSATQPDGPVLIHADTILSIARPQQDKPAQPRGEPASSYENIGGLRRELGKIREMIELPLRYPEVFERLGIDPPKGVLLYGPPGCGKTQIARAVARETDANFYAINGPEIVQKFYGESEAALRKIWDEAARNTPSIIFIDEIDSIAPRRENVQGEVEKRIVAQLLALMDGLRTRGRVMVIAATNLPNVLDPALRRPGRFDREIAIPVPDRAGRREILEIHSRGMPLAGDVNLEQIAAITHGFVGADLAALCREAAMNTLRRILPEIDFEAASIPYAALMQLEVRMEDFRAALLEVEPSAVREVLVEVPDVKWDDIGGLGAVKAKLIEAVEWPLKHTALYRQAGVRPPKGVLLSGPPGCGKTLLAKAAASQTEVNFITAKGSSLLSKYVGESERAVHEIFRKARQAAPVIIFFDEIDVLVPIRGSAGDSHVTDRVIGQFLTEMDGIEELNGVLILGATNRPDIIDPALLRPGRFDLHIQIPLPDYEGRREIFQINLRNKPVVGPMPIEQWAERTEGYSGAEIEAVCTQAAMQAIRQSLRAGGAVPVQVTADHVEAALDQVRPAFERL